MRSYACLSCGLSIIIRREIRASAALISVLISIGFFGTHEAIVKAARGVVRRSLKAFITVGGG